MFATLFSAGMSLLGGAQKAKAQRSQARRMRQAYDDAYALAKQVSPEEQKYMKRMQDRAETGDPNAGKMRNIVMSGLAQSAQRGQQGAQAIAIRSGLENSIVADELRRRVDTDTLKQIGQESQRLAMANRQYRLQAQGQLDQHQLGRAQMLRQMGMQTIMGKAGVPTGGEINAQAWGQFAEGAGRNVMGMIGSGFDSMLGGESGFGAGTFGSGASNYQGSGASSWVKMPDGTWVQKTS